jgi:hypothetical protein
MPDTDPTGQGWYHLESYKTRKLDPIQVEVVGTFSASGATCTVDTTKRRSHPGVTIEGASGDYDVAGLPRGVDYFVKGCNLLCADGTVEPCIATVQAGSLDPAAGTLTFQVRGSTAGAEAAPVNGTVIHLALEVETADDTVSF